MSTFDIPQNAPGLLRAEAMNMVLTFTRTGPTTGRISWNIPIPATGCLAGSQTYAGIVVTLDNTAASVGKIPAAGTVYTGDPTANTNLFAGDKIGTSFVVGAFYDTNTTFFDVTGLQPNAPYYITGFPVDAQYRYFIEGIHAYSMDATNKGTSDTFGKQIVVLNPEQAVMGVQPSDPTGLSVSLTYDFKIQVGLVPAPQSIVQSVDCIPRAPVYTIVVDGLVSQTYEDLVKEINKQLALATNNVQGAQPPNTGAYYWNTSLQQLFQWDGTTHNQISNVIIQNTAPNSVIPGAYWYNPIADVLSMWNGVVWTLVSVIKLNIDPTQPVTDKTYWFNGSTAYLWNGVAWCEVLTYIQPLDPSIVVPPPAGSYWFNTNNSTVYRWNETLEIWNVVNAIEYLVDPNALTTSDYWFNTTTNTNTLSVFNIPSPGWNVLSNVSISETAPTTPAPGKFWYNPTSMVLQQWNGATWVTLNVITFATDPTVRQFCDLWWDTLTSTLSVWDAINSVWALAPSVFYQGIDPTTSLVIQDGTAWWNTTTNTLMVWSNNCFNLVQFINWATNPIDVVTGTVWYNTITNIWYVRQVTPTWLVISPIVSSQDPTSLTAGTFWFNPSGPSLQQWNGSSWVTILYSTTLLTPQKGATWFNTTTNTLMMWNGLSWVVGTPVAAVTLDCNGNLLFTDNTPGGTSFVLLEDLTLFQSLVNKFAFHDPTPGSDGASNEASYNELGIGTDGSIDERLTLHKEVRFELGYPVIDVEVTTEQIDYAIDKALGEFRQKSSLAYKRGFFFMFIQAETQKYVLTSKISGMNKIVDVLAVSRLTSSFLSSAHGAGVYGQIVLQHMYNMGTFDLLSYHIMAEYTKLMEILFAARVTFTWNEQTRTLWLHNRFPFHERQVAIEATTERTEQDLLSDRYARPWLRRYTLATVRLVLAETRGKFSSLPGAGGAITLNASDLRQAATTEIDLLMKEIEDYVADKPEEYSQGGFVFG